MQANDCIQRQHVGACRPIMRGPYVCSDRVDHNRDFGVLADDFKLDVCKRLAAHLRQVRTG